MRRIPVPSRRRRTALAAGGPPAVLTALLLVALVSGLTLGRGPDRLLAVAVASAGAARTALRRRWRASHRRPSAPPVRGGRGA
ncbi:MULTISPECIES: hypothetical protein [unclassified Streptomyces]|uniref:hypothetical protein n=1 Tax=unclassified Streptomyces TaxID=2593676 RepID=UPI002E27EE7C|nr:hypothetical protein [Streptomyces sp. NBC_00223]